MKILLIQPPLDPITSQLSKLGLAEPLGLEYIASGVAAHDVRILDLRIDSDFEGILAAFAPDVVGTPAMTATMNTSLQILSRVKEATPETLTVIGGPHPTLLPEDCKHPQVDVIVLGEGEAAFAEIVRCLEESTSLDGVPNILFQKAGVWRQTSRNPLPPLDKYLLPARDKTAHYRHRYSRVGLGPIVSAVTSRGCSRRCSFCSVWRFHDGKYRTRTPSSIIEELESRPEKTIDFVDDDSFGNIKRMDELASLVARRLPDRQFRFFARADTIAKHPKLFERWKEAGLVQLLLGIESFRDDELKDMNKSASAAENRRALEFCKQLDIGVAGYLLVRPDFARDDFERLSDTVDEIGISLPVFTVMTPFPGTVFYEDVRNDLTTNNWDLFDGFHAVLPTRLPLQEFYGHVAGLYRKAYGKTATPGEETPWWESLAQTVERLADPPH